MSLSKVPDRRRRHLIDFDAPPPAPSAREAERRLTRVQQWVMSSLVVTTLLHLIVGLLIAAGEIDDYMPAKVGLSVISAIFGLIAAGVALAIHQRSPLSPWLVLGLVPTAIGCIWVF